MTNPRSFAQAVEITTATYDQIAHEYAEEHEQIGPHWRARMEQFVDLLAEAAAQHPIPDWGRPGDDSTLEEYLQFVPVLDAGCGQGRDARALAAYALPVLGIDLSQGMLDEAGERTPRRLRHGFIRYALMDLRRLELPAASCRSIWCSASLLHLPRHIAPRAVAELARVARAGAPMVVFLKRQGDFAQEEFQRYKSGDAAESTVDTRRFFAYYTPEEAHQLLEEAGWVVSEEAIVPHSDPAAPDWLSLVANKQ